MVFFFFLKIEWYKSQYSVVHIMTTPQKKKLHEKNYLKLIGTLRFLVKNTCKNRTKGASFPIRSPGKAIVGFAGYPIRGQGSSSTGSLAGWCWVFPWSMDSSLKRSQRIFTPENRQKVLQKEVGSSSNHWFFRGWPAVSGRAWKFDEMNIWAVLSDEQMSNGCQFSLLNDEHMSNWLGVQHQPDMDVMWRHRALQKTTGNLIAFINQTWGSV